MGHPIVKLPPGAVSAILKEYVGPRTNTSKRGTRRWFRWTAENGTTVEGPSKLYRETRLKVLLGGRVPSESWLSVFLLQHGKRCHAAANGGKPRRTRRPQKAVNPLMRPGLKEALMAGMAPSAKPFRVSREPRAFVAEVVKMIPPTKANIAWLGDVLRTLPDTPQNRAWLAHVGQQAFSLWSGLTTFEQ